MLSISSWKWLFLINVPLGIIALIWPSAFYQQTSPMTLSRALTYQAR
ncbi:putative membrane transport protein [Salmonella enterica subsp. enterica serovar Heidelberg str. RI-11-014316]|nr:putative membrane transport protein [Salmonella enterica subsp. enterica serovar Heidelberg str. RI-11-014316]